MVGQNRNGRRQRIEGTSVDDLSVTVNAGGADSCLEGTVRRIVRAFQCLHIGEYEVFGGHVLSSFSVSSMPVRNTTVHRQFGCSGGGATGPEIASRGTGAPAHAAP